MLNGDPDALVRRLWRLRERLSSPVSSIPYETSGSVWAESCRACSHERHWRSAGGVECCSRCGTPWPQIEGRVAKGSTKRVRTNAMERALHDLAVCVSILNHVPDPSRTLYEQHFSPLGGGMRYALDAARQLGVCGSMSEHSYYVSIRQAREIVGLRLSYAQAAMLSERRTA